MKQETRSARSGIPGLQAGEDVNYANSALGDYLVAQDLNKHALVRWRRVLGEDHPDALASAHILAADLAALGDHEAARALGEDTLAPPLREWDFTWH